MTTLTGHAADTYDAEQRPFDESLREMQAEHRIERKILIYLVGCVLVLTTVVAQVFGIVDGGVAQIPAVIGAVLLGAPLFWAAAKEVAQGRSTSSTLAALAILAALATGIYVIAGFLAAILLLADQFVRRTAWGAQHAIRQLIGLTPDTARIVEDGSERTVRLGEVRVGSVVRVRPGENLPVDGTVTAGRSTINQASLTGEAVPVEVSPGDPVYAGTTNLTGGIDLKVTNVGADTAIGKVTQLIHEAEGARTPRQMLIEQVAGYFVPVAISVAGLVWYFTSQSDDPETRSRATLTAITVLVVMCPSALLLASPTAMVAAFAAAARLRIMIKQTNYLEASANVDAVVLDKTGTLTTGVFAVSRLVPADGVQGAALLQAAADGEQNSNHPLARSIMHTARQARIEPAKAEHYEEVHGRGVKARTANGEVAAGRRGWIAELNPGAAEQIAKVDERMEGMTGVHVMRGGQYLGAVGLEDEIRPNAKAAMDRLRSLGVQRLTILTGDRAPVARRVAAAVGADSVEAECLPEQKHERVRSLVVAGRRVLMVGDGINDGPSLAAADVGVAMGLGGSDIAANSAGVVLMNDDLSRVPFLIELARRARAVVAQNLVASFILIAIGLSLAATGQLNIYFAAPWQIVGAALVFGNSFRLVRFGEEYAETEVRGPARPGSVSDRGRSEAGGAPTGVSTAPAMP